MSPSPPLPLRLIRLIAEAEDHAAALAGLDGGDPALPPAELAEARRLLTPAAFARVRGVLQAVDHSATTTPEALAEAFDRAAAVSPEGGVALYSLGDPALLAAATGEVVAWMEAQNLLGPGRRVLEVGCGIGRFLTALAPCCELVLGLDISAGMIAEAGRRSADLANALPVRTSGRELCVADASVDLVLFADSFPYLVQVGGELPERHFRDAARVLRPHGRLLILNFSYRGDPARDHADADQLARRSGLERLPIPQPKFAGWDATAFLFAAMNGG